MVTDDSLYACRFNTYIHIWGLVGSCSNFLPVRNFVRRAPESEDSSYLGPGFLTTRRGAGRWSAKTDYRSEGKRHGNRKSGVGRRDSLVWMETGLAVMVAPSVDRRRNWELRVLFFRLRLRSWESVARQHTARNVLVL